MPSIQSIVPCLWFDDQAEEAVRFYTGLFENSRITDISRYLEAGKEIHGHEPGSVLSLTFELNGQPFMALNGGPMFKLTEAVSFQIMCETQHEVDYFWTALTADGGEESMCGWLKDRFGLSWQVLPAALPKLLNDPDPEKSTRAMNAMFQMQKLDLATLEKAFAGE